MLLVRHRNQRITIESTPFFTSLDKVLAEIENRFSGNDQVLLCALVDVTLSDPPASDSFDPVAGYYNFDKEQLQADQRLFNRFKKKIMISGKFVQRTPANEDILS